MGSSASTLLLSLHLHHNAALALAAGDLCVAAAAAIAYVHGEMFFTMQIKRSDFLFSQL